MQTIAHTLPIQSINVSTSTHELKTAAASTKTVVRQHFHPGMLRLEYLHKMLLYALLCLLAKALAANLCFGFAMQYCQLRTPNARVVLAKAFRWHKPSEALFFSFI